MYFNEILDRIAQVTGRPDVPLGTFIPQVCEEIRLSGHYEEDLMESEDYVEDYDPAYGTSRWVNYSQKDIVVIQATLESGIVDLEKINFDNWAMVKKCPPPNSYYKVREDGQVFKIRTESEPLLLRIIAYDRQPFEAENNKASFHMWPLESVPSLVIAGVAAKVMLAVGDDASRDRYYTEYLRLLRQFQLSRVES